MDSRRLRYFVQIVDSGSITRAAAVAGVAQPALSQQVAILENELKVQLLNRSVSGITPTAAGRVLYARAQAILRQFDELRTAVHREVQPLSGTVVLGVSPSLVQRLALPLIEKACSQHPEMHLQILEGGSAQLEELLSSGRIELSISPTPPSEGEIAGTRILEDELKLVYPCDGTDLDRASLMQLAQLPWIVTRPPHSIRSILDAIFKAHNLTPRVVVEIDSLYSVVECIKRGLGVSLLPVSSVAHEIISGTVRSAACGPMPVSRPIYLAHAVSPVLSTPAQFVHDLLLEIAADLRASEVA
jgi:DNA-binding transcriptional LysR family regulator